MKKDKLQEWRELTEEWQEPIYPFRSLIESFLKSDRQMLIIMKKPKEPKVCPTCGCKNSKKEDFEIYDAKFLKKDTGVETMFIRVLLA